MRRVSSKTQLFPSILLAGSTVVAYYLKSNGFPSVLVFLSVAVSGWLYGVLSGKKVESTDLLFSALFFFYLSLPLASRGPSLNNLLFILSFSALLSRLLEDAERQNLPVVAFLAPVFSVWAVVGNWEFPSVFSPFAVYGKRELAFLSAATVLAAGRAASTKVRLGAMISSLALLTPAAELYLRSEILAFQELENINVGVATAVLALSVSSVLFWLKIGTSSERRATVLFKTLTLTPVVITAFSWLHHAFVPRLPLPFDGATMAFALMFSLSLYLLGFNALTHSSRPFFYFTAAFFLVRLFAPAELNIYDHGGIRYGNYSFGFEHLGPLFFVWLFALLGSSEAAKRFALPALLASALLITRVYFTRLYHFSKAAPVEFFKDLGSEGVSWIRKPVVPAEPYYAFLVAVIICIAYLAVTKILTKEKLAP